MLSTKLHHNSDSMNLARGHVNPQEQDFLPNSFFMPLAINSFRRQICGLLCGFLFRSEFPGHNTSFMIRKRHVSNQKFLFNCKKKENNNENENPMSKVNSRDVRSCGEAKPCLFV